MVSDGVVMVSDDVVEESGIGVGEESGIGVGEESDGGEVSDDVGVSATLPGIVARDCGLGSWSCDLSTVQSTQRHTVEVGHDRHPSQHCH
jgi:hypothetical protein